MLLVKTYIADSTIHGFGLFAAEFIPRGKPIWIFTRGFDRMVPRATVQALPEPARTQTILQSTFDAATHRYLVFGDDMKFLNHSLNPNTVDLLGQELAYVDVKAGEELTCCYQRFRRRLFPRET